MCGITGYQLARTTTGADRVLRMTRAVAHRGPDDEGIALFPVTGAPDAARDQRADGVHRIAFGHRRFSIVDISAAGHQPFWSADRRVCLAFNGEIYNFLELREELRAAGYSFRTRCDTEVIVAAYQAWGEACFVRFTGFWALSLYDATRGEVLLARDRLGKAPLYVTRQPEGLFWASEIKALHAALGRDRFNVNPEAVLNYARHGWRDVDDMTFYSEIVTFPAASHAWVRGDGSFTPSTFWSVPEERLSERDLPVGEAASTLRRVLERAVSLRMRADVPVGVELSGGLDSSAVFALAASSTPHIHAFTVGFPNTEADETHFARAAVSRYSGQTEHVVLEPPDDAFIGAADHFVALMDEPFHAPNLQTNQSVWRAMAARGIRVSLNGAGGDEVLAGYVWDYHAPFLRHMLRRGRIGTFAREFASLTERRRGSMRELAVRAYALLPVHGPTLRNPLSRARKGADPFLPPKGAKELPGASWEINRRLRDNVGTWRMNYWLRSGHTSMMGVPLEARFPFLDHEVVEFAFRLPLAYLIRGGWMKWILREAVTDLLPPEVTWRRAKMGFPFPATRWLQDHRTWLLAQLHSTDCPYVDLRRLEAAYGRLAQREPFYLWRLLNLGLWWKRCVRNEPLG